MATVNFVLFNWMAGAAAITAAVCVGLELVGFIKTGGV